MKRRYIYNGPVKSYIVDEDTGQVIAEVGSEGQLVFVPKKEKRLNEFIIFTQVTLGKFSEEYKFSGTVYRVLLKLASMTGFENFVHFNQAVIAKELGLTRPCVCVVVQRLRKAGILETYVDRNAVKHDRLSPALAWKGHLQSLGEHVRTTTKELADAKDK